jgi:branched-chain amino acid transport system permease protein
VALMSFGLPLQLILPQLLLGIINGAFYALLSLGLAVIFGVLNIINFAHGALFMLGAFITWILLNSFGLGYWEALVIAPLIVGVIGILLERLFIRHLYDVDHIYSFLFTFGLALAIEGSFKQIYGTSSLSYPVPALLNGGIELDVMFLPIYRAWIVGVSVLVCLVSWFLIEKTSLGAKLRASTENANQVRAFGINVPRLVMLTYGAGVALAAFAGVLAAPVYSVNANMGSSIVILVFAVVVIGGMGSILGSTVTGFTLGLVEGITKVFYPEGSSVVIFVVMAVVLLVRPAGLFGREA